MVYDVAIVGGGPAGLAAVLTQQLTGGQLRSVSRARLLARSETTLPR